MLISKTKSDVEDLRQDRFFNEKCMNEITESSFLFILVGERQDGLRSVSLIPEYNNLVTKY